jgi:hypothetical protein
MDEQFPIIVTLRRGPMATDADVREVLADIVQRIDLMDYPFEMGVQVVSAECRELEAEDDD